MTVRYTAVDSMEEAALRDVDRNAERWRDKIELRLDNRQVFFLFFGSAVVASPSNRSRLQNWPSIGRW